MDSVPSDAESVLESETIEVGASSSSDCFPTIEQPDSIELPHQLRQYPSLYDSYGTTFIAIVLAIGIVSSVIGIVTYIFKRAKSDHAALTQFVTTMFALIAGVYIADKIVAGPSTELLGKEESLKVLEFIQQTCLIVFAYYFGTKAQQPKEEPPNYQD